MPPSLNKLHGWVYTHGNASPPAAIMFDALKSLLGDLLGDAPDARPFEALDHRLAAAALLVHVAAIDGVVGDAERARLRRIVESRLGLDPHAAARLIDEAWESEREAVDLDRFTSVLKRRLDADGRRQVVAMLWEMAGADGAIDEFEETVVERIATALDAPATRPRASGEANGPDRPGKEQP